MRDRPILFSAPMIRALLEGRKTQTRRFAGAQLVLAGNRVFDPETPHHVPLMLDRSRYGKAGGRLWVRETWYDDMPDEPAGELADGRRILFRADHDCASFEAGCPCNPDGDGKRSAWRPSIFMPRWASRFTLEVVDVRVERLHAITDEDARAEGVTLGEPMKATINGEPGTARIFDPRKAFAVLWDQINGDGAWEKNPYVWRVEFRRVA